MDSDFIKAVQIHVARSAVTPTAVCGRAKGTVSSARDFLAALPLNLFGVSRASLFDERLNLATDKLMRKLPEPFWGVSRKVLNIFLRDSLYNFYLRESYSLINAEWLLEVPVDSNVAATLHRSSQLELPEWKGVMHLQPEENRLYQEAASLAAGDMARVHLDVDWQAGDRSRKGFSVHDSRSS